MADITIQDIWTEIDKHVFAVIGMVTARSQARTVGIYYTTHDGRLYFGTSRDEWKTRHIAQNGDVSATIPIEKRIPFVPWLKIPAATITFAGAARILEPAEAPPTMVETLTKGLVEEEGAAASTVIIEISPVGDFVTYGVGVSLSKMRDTELARGRVPSGGPARG